MVIQCKNLISLYILPDQRRVNLRYFDFDQNRLWGATSLYLFSFSLHFTRSTTGGNLLVLYKKQTQNQKCILQKNTRKENIIASEIVPKFNQNPDVFCSFPSLQLSIQNATLLQQKAGLESECLAVDIHRMNTSVPAKHIKKRSLFDFFCIQLSTKNNMVLHAKNLVYKSSRCSY